MRPVFKRASSSIMWTYKQSTGNFIASDNQIIATGYSGNGPGLNNPLLQLAINIGPIPAGIYTLLTPIDTYYHGPFFIPLRPSPTNIMFNRYDFGIHGDEIAHPGQHLASDGCIILPRAVRNYIWGSGDHQLMVMCY